MAPYLILNTLVLTVVVGIVAIGRLKNLRLVFVTMIILLLLTAVFDSLIIWAKIVEYNPEKILGLYIGKAPIEDFFYSIVAALLIPALWQLLGRNHE